MPRRLPAKLALALVIGVLLMGMQQVAVGAPGSGPDSALAPGSGWTPLAVGQQVWYAFQYAGDSSQILVDLRVSPSNAATFAVWTPATLASWAAGNVPKPVGVGSSDNYINGDLVWLGKFNEPGTYYVVVNQTGSAAGGILLSVIGSGVSSSAPGPTLTPGPAATAALTATPAPTSTPAPTGSPAVAASALPEKTAPTAPTAPPAGGNRTSIRQPSARSVPGSGPDAALSPGSGWTPLAVGQQVWYAFQYVGDRSQVMVDMGVSPSNAAGFAVWTSATLADWAAGNVPKPVGVGSLDNHVGNGDLVWSGSFNQPGTYYVVVNQAGTVAGGTLLRVTGSGVYGAGRGGAQLGGR